MDKVTYGQDFWSLTVIQNHRRCWPLRRLNGTVAQGASQPRPNPMMMNPMMGMMAGMASMASMAKAMAKARSDEALGAMMVDHQQEIWVIPRL